MNTDKNYVELITSETEDGITTVTFDNLSTAGLTFQVHYPSPLSKPETDNKEKHGV